MYRHQVYKHSVFASFFLVLGFCHPAISNQQATVTHRDRSNAISEARSVNIDVAVYEIGDVSSLGDAKATLEKLQQLENRADWPVPAREAAIYRFTQSLTDLPRDAVAPEVMQYLQSYRPRTLVPHDEHQGTAVPLFNIRRAATGVENGWQRVEFAGEAESLLASQPATLVTAYAGSGNSNQRYAYLETLRHTDVNTAMEVQTLALRQLDKTPALTPVIGVTAVKTADPYALEQLLTLGQGAGFSSALEVIGEQFTRSEISDLLGFAIKKAPPANATLAIAAWWPILKHDAATRDLLIKLLADPDLGASAALALAQSPDIQTIKALLDTAGGDTTAARRAQMALDINRDQLVGEVQP
jgi:hypothetical protein